MAVAGVRAARPSRRTGAVSLGFFVQRAVWRDRFLGTSLFQLLGRLLSFPLAAFAAWPGHTTKHFVGLLSLDRRSRQWPDVGTGYPHHGAPQSGWIGGDPDVQSRAPALRRQQRRRSSPH